MARRIALVIALATLAARPLGAQSAGVPTGSVVGTVFDSVTGAPLREALVQLESRELGSRTAATDSLGWFRFPDVPAGRYIIGFLHPMLDSLGLEPPLRRLEVAVGSSERLELAVPAPARIRAAICGPQSSRDASAVVVGTVRDAASHSPVAGASVVAEWLEITFQAGGMRQRVPRLVATTGENGWFALCNVPRGGTMALRAALGADSTDRIEIQVPEDGFLRRELYLGTVRTVAVVDTVVRTDGDSGDSATVATMRQQRGGEGRLRGRVLTADGDRPLAGAQVRVVDGPSARSDAEGRWVLAGVPPGSRMLEVRAVGFYPERVAVNVIDGAPPVSVALRTMRAVLDTVLVTARGTFDQSGFLTRQRTGSGRYLTAEQIRLRQPVFTSEIFRWLPGFEMERSPDGGRTITMRGGFGGRCTPAVFVDGRHLLGFDPDDLDGWVDPKKIRGIEVYTDGMAPPEFAPSGMAAGGAVAEAGCGVVLIWTR